MENDTISSRAKLLKSPVSEQIKKDLHRIAHLNTAVLFCGETGVGKDFWAEYLFRLSGKERFLNLNCGDVPETLMESEWFGYEKGAFSGADRAYAGKWAEADGGMLYLNQLDLLNLNQQSRLLRVLERKKLFPLGSNVEREIDIRFLFSCDAGIRDRVKSGEFRSDLYFRVSTYQIDIPPLRERPQDIMPLIRYFADLSGLALDLSPDGIDRLKQYRWYGNIRELENFVKQSALADTGLNDRRVDMLYDSGPTFFDAYKEKELSLEAFEREYIQFLLKKYKNKSRVAKILKIARKSLYNKLERYEKD